ncbi:MAG TPA: TldD/PmbA family protein [Acidimicrobiales bacterium]|nr:TldD/PmbA family protein [Acidimicrobiales bacterium]
MSAVVDAAAGVEPLLELAQRVADQARQGEQVEAFVARYADTSVRVYEGEIEHLTSARSEGIGVRVIRDGRTGFAYAGTLDHDAVADVLAEARDNVAFGTPDEFAGLAEPDGVTPVQQDLWRDDLATFPTEQKVALARELEQATLGADRRVRVEESDYGDVLAEAAVATSTGIASAGRQTAASLSVGTLADDGDVTHSGFGFTVGRSPADFDLGKAACDAAERATRLIGATKPATGKVTVVLDPFVTAQLLRVMSATLNGEAVSKGRSFFAGRLGEVVASPLFTLVDDPTNPLAYTASEVDGEGLGTRRNVLVEAGVLQMFVQSAYSARRAGTVSTGNAVRGGFSGPPRCGCLALSLAPGTKQQAALVAGVDDGLLVQSVQGLHSGVNPVSGDFSTGASGLLIRGGELGAPVKEFTIASTLQRMLLDVVEVGGDVEWLPMSASGVTLVVRDVTMSGT